MTNYVHYQTFCDLATLHDLRISMSRVETVSRFDSLSDIRAAVEADGRRYYINFPDKTSELVIKTLPTWEETFAAYADECEAILKEMDI